MLRVTDQSRLLSALKIGAMAGTIAILISLVGMVEEFAKRDIIAGVVDMGQTLIVVTLLAAGFFAGRRAAGAPWWVTASVGALAGAIAAFLPWVLVQIIEPLDLRSIFLNASPVLIGILTMGLDGVPALLGMLALGGVAGLAGGLIQSLPTRWRNAVVAGFAWVALIGLLQELIRITLAASPAITNALSWMFGGRSEKGLSIAGAVVVFVLVAGTSILASRPKTAGPSRLAGLPAQQRRILGLVGWGALAAVILYLPQVLGPYLSEVTNSVGLFILMGLGLNIVVGFAGLLDLGYVAFFAIGAYVMGVLTSTAIGHGAGQIVWGPGLTFWEALPIAVFISVAAGIALGIPVLNIRGDYLAIVTLGFGEIIRILAGSDFLKPYIGGSQGIVQVARSNIGPLDLHAPQGLYYLIIAAIVLAAFVSWRLRDSRIGRAWKALREDEDVAQAMGIHLVSTKLMAFATGAAFAGLSGAIFASKIGSIYPHSFKLLVSLNVLALIIVGGMGSLRGVFVGGLILVGLPELLREFSEYRVLVYGALLIIMMLTKPEGFVPEATRKQELHAAEPESVAPTPATD